MQVKCISTNLEEYSKLISDKVYVVYGMIIYKEQLNYFLCDKYTNGFPYWYACPHFEIVHNRISRYWVFTYMREEGYATRPLWTFPEWAENKDYWDNLVDWHEEEEDILRKYKELMDLEFPDSSVKESAGIVDSEWLMCHSCIDAWHSTNVLDALVKCPYCQQKLNNPRYIPDFTFSHR